MGLACRSEAKRTSTEHVLIHPCSLSAAPSQGYGRSSLVTETPRYSSCRAMFLDNLLHWGVLELPQGRGQGPKGSGRGASQSAIQQRFKALLRFSLPLSAPPWLCMGDEDRIPGLWSDWLDLHTSSRKSRIKYPFYRLQEKHPSHSCVLDSAKLSLKTPPPNTHLLLPHKER